MKPRLPLRVIAAAAVFIDIVIILAADISSFMLRYGIDVHRDNLGAYRRIAFFVVALRVICLYVFGLYEKPKYKTSFENIVNIVKAMTVSTLIIIAVAYFSREFAYPRTVILLSWGLTAALITGWRVVVRYLINALLGHDYFVSHLLIIGTDQSALRLMLQLTRRAGIKTELVGYIATDSSEPAVERAMILGSVEDIPAVISTRPVDEAVISSPDLPRERVAEIFTYFINTDIIFKTVPDLYEAVVGRVAATAAGKNVPLIELTISRYGRGWYRSFKRVLDILFSIAALAVTGPFIMLPVAILIKLTSRGPVFHKQERAGLHCRPFTMLKFRTMAADSEKETGPVWASPNDSRILGVGRFLRRTHLDELPQFINVLRGEMSIVGPRPERPHFVRSLLRSIPFYTERLEVKPGITGWSQVNLRYAASLESNAQKLVSDLYYIENMSLLLDIWIMVRTVGMMLGGRGV